VAYCVGCVAVIFDTRANAQRLFLKAPSAPKPFACVAFSSDGTRLAAGEAGSHPAVIVWDTFTGECLAELRTHKHGVADVCFSPSGQFIASCGTTYDSQLCYWSLQSKSLLAREKTQVQLRSVAFSSDGSCIISAGKGHLRVWSVSQVGGGRGPGNHKGTVTLSGRNPILGTCKGHTVVGVAVPAVSGMGPSVIHAITDQGALLQLKTNSRSFDKKVNLQVREAFSIAASQSAIAVGCSDGIVRLFSARTLAFKANLPRPAAFGDHGLTDHRKSVSKGLNPGASSLFPDAVALSFDGTGDRLAVVYADHSLFVWDIHDLSKVGRHRSLLGHSGPIWDVCSIPDPSTKDPLSRQPPSGTFATCSADGTVRLWNLGRQSQGEKVSSPGPGSWPSSTFCRELIGVMHASRPQAPPAGAVSSPPEERPVGQRLQAEAPSLRCLKASPDGEQIAAGDKAGNLWVFDVPPLAQSLMIEAHDTEILSLDFSAAGDKGGYLLASAGGDSAVHVYDPKKSYERLATLDDHSSAVVSVRFADRGLRVVTCSADREVVFRSLDGDPEPEGSSCRSRLEGRGPLYDMGIEKTERYVMIAGEDRRLTVFQISSGKWVKTHELPEGVAAAVRLYVDPAGINLAAAHSDHTIGIYDFFTGKMLARATGHGDIVTGCIITPDCQRLVTVGGDGCILVYRMTDKLVRDSLKRLKELQNQHKGESGAEPCNSNGASGEDKGGNEPTEQVAAERHAKALRDEHTKEACTGSPSFRGAFDIEDEPLMSERLKQGRGLISTKKLPHWAQVNLGQTPSPLTGADNGGGGGAASGEASGPCGSERDGLQMGKWGQRAMSGNLIFGNNHMQTPGGRPNRRLTAEPSELQPSVEPSAEEGDEPKAPNSCGSHPEIAAAAEEDDMIVYEDHTAEAAGDEAFPVECAPVNIEDAEAVADAPAAEWGPGAAGTARAEGGEAQEPSHFPRSNLFEEHFGQLLQDGPPPQPPEGSREAARQSFSAQVRALDERGAGGEGPDDGGDDGGGGGGDDAGPVPAGGLSEPELREGAEKLKEERYLLRQRARKGRMKSEVQVMRERLVEMGAALEKQQNEARRGRISVGDRQGIGSTSAAAPKGEFCMGQSASEGRGIVADAVEEAQNGPQRPPSPKRFGRTRSTGRSSLDSGTKAGARAQEASAPPPAGSFQPLGTAADTKTPAGIDATKFTNPAYDMTPESVSRPVPFARASIKQLQEQGPPMEPGHRVISVCYDGDGGEEAGAVALAEEVALPPDQAPERLEPSSNGSAPLANEAGDGSVSDGGWTGSPAVAAEDAEEDSGTGSASSEKGGPPGPKQAQCAAGSQAEARPGTGRASSADRKGLASVRDRMHGFWRRRDNNPPTRRSAPGGTGSSGAAASAEAGKVPQEWSELPDGGAALLRLCRAAEELRAMHTQLSGARSEPLQQLLKAEVGRTVEQLAAVGLVPSRETSAPRSPSRADTPAIGAQGPDCSAGSMGAKSLSLTSSIGLQELSQQFESVLEVSAERYSEQLAERVGERLEQRLLSIIEEAKANRR